MTEAQDAGKGWPRVAGLFLLTLSISVTGPGVLIAVPFILLALFRPSKRAGLLLVTALAAFVVAGGRSASGFWWVERGWALLVGGWFLALTLRWPGARFFPRAMGAVVGAYAAAATLFAARPRTWDVVDWLVADRMRSAVASALSLVRSGAGSDAVPAELVDAVYRTVETQGLVFPALLGLASLGALGVAWWLYVRLATGSDQALGPLPRFRFHDQLVWFLIVGLGLVLAGSSGALERAGTNAVVFMGALYALRGAAVLLFLSGGLSLAATALVVLAMIFVAPVLLAGALIVGLGDTWLDLREKARAAAGGGAGRE